MGREACFSFHRKYSLCWVRFMIPEVFLFQIRSWEICTLRNLVFSTLSTVRLLILRGACSGYDLRKSIIMSSVLSALSTRLFSVHQHSRYLISSLYIGFTISVNASHYCGVIANLMIWFPLCLDAQSCVSGVNNNGLITQPRGDPVLIVMELEVLFLTRTNRGLSVWKSWIQRHGVVFSPNRRSFSISFWVMVLNAELKSSTGFCHRCCSGFYCILCWAVGMISKLM